jgi:polysaccharide biosynthesis transport protein
MEELTLLDCLKILKQQKTIFFVVFCIILIAAIVFVSFWSNYRSTATIEIEQPQVASDITTPMGMNPNDMPEALADLRINRIKEKVTSPSSLIDIIGKYDLYANRRSSEPMASLADRMGGKIALRLISSEIANPAASQKVSAGQLSAIAFIKRRKKFSTSSLRVSLMKI